MLCYYFTRLTAREINYKIWEARKMFAYCTRHHAITTAIFSRSKLTENLARVGKKSLYSYDYLTRLWGGGFLVEFKCISCIKILSYTEDYLRVYTLHDRHLTFETNSISYVVAYDIFLILLCVLGWHGRMLRLMRNGQF